MIDEELLEILKEVARGNVAFDVMEKAYCLHHTDCDGSMQHSPECIVTKSRRILQQNGIVLNLYVITFDYQNKQTGKWNPYTQHDVGYSVEEVEKRYKEGHEWQEKNNGEKHRNLKVTFDTVIS